MYTKRNRSRFRSFGLLLAALWLACLARPEAAQAQERATEAYQRAYELVLDEEWGSASSALKDFLQDYSRTDWVDDARFWQCYVQEKSGGSDENVFECYQDFVNHNDESKWVDDARSNMVTLAQRLARSGKREYMTIIESIQAEGDEEVKLAALDALWQMGDESALDAVLDLYDDSASEKFRKKVIFALSEFDAPRAAEKLKDIALQDPNPTIRKEAIFWISQNSSAEAIALLEEIAREEDSVEVQKQIVFAYSQMDEEGVPQLIQMARTHSHPEVQKEAIFWLSQIGGSAVLDFFDALIDESDDEEVQKGLVFAFSELEEEGAPRLIAIARTHRNPEIRKDAIFWLSQIGGPAVLDFFGVLLNESDDEEVQKGLVFAFSQLDEEGVPHLIRIAKSHNSQKVRKDAIFWLGQTDDPRAREALLEIVRGQD